MSNENEVHGTVPVQEVSTESIHRDIRPSSVKIQDSLRSPATLVNFLLVLATGAFVLPQFGDLLAIVAILTVSYSFTVKKTAPLKLPAQSKLLDFHELTPGIGLPQKAKGIFYLGNETSTGKEVWLSDTDCRQHFLVLGTTGSGKTETLLGFATNALLWGSGFIYCDGKGDASLFAKVYALARRFGREDDVYVLNFMTGNRDIYQKRDYGLSNSINPFYSGSSDFLTQLVVSLMDDTSGEGNMWKGRAAVMLSCVLRALVWLRDHDFIKLDVRVLREYLNIRKIIDLGYSDNFRAIPEELRDGVKSYLTSLPGFIEEKRHGQSATTLSQHGFLEMQFTKILGSLADVYGHIFTDDCGEIDMQDIVTNRRILVVMLPALEKSRDEVLNVGKIIVATIKGMMGQSLGSDIAGTWNEVVANRLSARRTPYLCIFDEIGYYMVGGMDIMAAQSRSLGFSMVYSGQDINAMKAYNDKVFGSVQGNTNTKIIMRTEDPDTGHIAKESASMAYRVQMSSFKNRSGIVSNFYEDGNSAELEHVHRINYLDLKTQNEGEMHVIYKDKVVRVEAFYADPESVVDLSRLQLHPNTFVGFQSDGVSNSDQIAMFKVFENLTDAKRLENRKERAANWSEDDNIFSYAAKVFAIPNNFSNAAEQSCIAFAAVMKINRSNPARFKKSQSRGNPDDGKVEQDNGSGTAEGTVDLENTPSSNQEDSTGNSESAKTMESNK